MRHLGSREAGCTPYEAGDGDFIARLAEVVADADDRHLATYVTGGPVPDGRLLRGELAKLSKGAQAHPVYFGSELTGAGVEAATAADIAKLWGLAKVRIGDSIGTADRGSDQTYFAPPTLETVVVPADRRQKEALSSLRSLSWPSRTR